MKDTSARKCLQCFHLNISLPVCWEQPIGQNSSVLFFSLVPHLYTSYSLPQLYWERFESCVGKGSSTWFIRADFFFHFCVTATLRCSLWVYKNTLKARSQLLYSLLIWQWMDFDFTTFCKKKQTKQTNKKQTLLESLNLLSLCLTLCSLCLFFS